MRQNQQQNRRGRGRSGRKGQSPLSRSFESSGPDIKIRGTAQHVAEKYMALARDAIGSGDLVLGENYLQHAEHYNRIIMAAQVANPSGFDQSNPNGQRIARPEGDLQDGEGFEGDDDGEADQPMAGGGFEQPRTFEPNQNQREFQPPQQPQGNQPRYRDNRDNRNFENRNFDNRNYENRDNRNNNQPRSFEPRNQGGGENRGENRGRDNNQQRRYEQPENFPPRFLDPPRVNHNNGSGTGNGNSTPVQAVDTEQPRALPVEIQDAAPPAAGFEPRPQAEGPRGRRRRGPRAENGTSRPPFAAGGDVAADSLPLAPAHNDPSDSNGNSGSSDGQSE